MVVGKFHKCFAYKKQKYNYEIVKVTVPGTTIVIFYFIILFFVFVIIYISRKLQVMHRTKS